MIIRSEQPYNIVNKLGLTFESLREGVINTQREGRGGVCTGSSTLRESFENRFVCISPVKNPFENRFVCISPAKNPFENRFVCTFLVKNPFENRFVCIFPVKDPFENPFGSRFTLCPALIILQYYLYKKCLGLGKG